MSDQQRDPHEKNHALKVIPGVENAPSLNPMAVARVVRKPLSLEDYFEGIRACDRMVLSRAITLVESTRPDHRALARQIVNRCLSYAGQSIRVGITGVPGAGKSTLLETLGLYLTGHDHRVAVLAIDPSSERTKGSILGDKTRMEGLSADPRAFIRPTPTGGSLGGVARTTRETTLLCEAAGFDVVFIETVGVGQSETTVHSMVDFFLLLILAGSGDVLQGIKRGIVEMADALVITKADQENKNRADLARIEYQNALHLFPPPDSGWIPPVLTCSAVENKGIEELWQTIRDYREKTLATGFFDRNRQQQARHWMHQAIAYELQERFFQSTAIQAALQEIEGLVEAGKLSPFDAAHRLLNAYFHAEQGG